MTLTQGLRDTDSMLASIADPVRAPEMLAVREALRGWRFYDGFRTDEGSPARTAQLGTFTPVLDHGGGNLAAALQTIQELRSDEALDTAVADAFPGSQVSVDGRDGWFELRLQQRGLLRALSAAELSDGTLRDEARGGDTVEHAGSGAGQRVRGWTELEARGGNDLRLFSGAVWVTHTGQQGGGFLSRLYLGRNGLNKKMSAPNRTAKRSVMESRTPITVNTILTRYAFASPKPACSQALMVRVGTGPGLRAGLAGVLLPYVVTTGNF